MKSPKRANPEGERGRERHECFPGAGREEAENEE